MQDDQAEQVKKSLLALQDSLQNRLIESDPHVHCKQDQWKRDEGGGGKTLAFQKGKFIEKGGINFSDVSGKKLPKTATQNTHALQNRAWLTAIFIATTKIPSFPPRLSWLPLCKDSYSTINQRP